MRLTSMSFKEQRAYLVDATLGAEKATDRATRDEKLKEIKNILDGMLCLTTSVGGRPDGLRAREPWPRRAD